MDQIVRQPLADNKFGNTASPRVLIARCEFSPHCTHQGKQLAHLTIPLLQCPPLAGAPETYTLEKCRLCV